MHRNVLRGWVYPSTAHNSTPSSTHVGFGSRLWKTIRKLIKIVVYGGRFWRAKCSNSRTEAGVSRAIGRGTVILRTFHLEFLPSHLYDSLGTSATQISDNLHFSSSDYGDSSELSERIDRSSVADVSELKTLGCAAFTATSLQAMDPRLQEQTCCS